MGLFVDVYRENGGILLDQIYEWVGPRRFFFLSTKTTGISKKKNDL